MLNYIHNNRHSFDNRFEATDAASRAIRRGRDAARLFREHAGEGAVEETDEDGDDDGDEDEDEDEDEDYGDEVAFDGFREAVIASFTGLQVDNKGQ